MLSIGGTIRVFVALPPVDLRASFHRRHDVILEVLRAGPQSGHWFIFTNRRRIDPMEYLKDVLSRLPAAVSTDIDKFTPMEWAEARRRQAPAH